MRSTKWFAVALIVAISAIPAAAMARAFSVSVWTDRGNDAVYKPGEALEIKAKSSEDSYLLIYEIDAEGYVHLLYPDRRSRGFVEAGRTMNLSDDPNFELVAQGPVGQGYIVAIASIDGFRDIPWYLRPYDSQAEEIGYYGGPDDEENEEQGVTAEGRIVGDPFVAMERIRRRVLEDPNDNDTFATSYSSYYVHNEVRYPRYLCYDCHRPNHWSWWDGFDPYYTSCSTFNFRVNWSWWWGPGYWRGFVPYYVYVYRSDCPPRYRGFFNSGASRSSWDGWRRWRNEFGERLTRYKSAPPADYVPPDKFVERGKIRSGARIPPGFLAGDGRIRDASQSRPGERLLRERQRGRLLDPGRRERRDGSAQRSGDGTSDVGRMRRGGRSLPRIEPRNDSDPGESVRRRRLERPDPAPAPDREPSRPPRNFDRPRREDQPPPPAPQPPVREERRPLPPEPPKSERPPDAQRQEPPREAPRPLPPRDNWSGRGERRHN